MTIGTWVRENKREVTVFLVFLVVYCGSITLNYSLSHDSTYYLNDIEYGPWIFHPHHLLFHIVAKMWMHMVGVLPFAGGLDIAYRVGTLNAVFGSLTLATLVHFAERTLRLPRFTTNVLIALIGFSFTFWYYSGCAEVYIIPLFFIVRSIIALHAFAGRTGSLTTVVVWVSLATLFHQSNIILFGTLLVYVAMFRRDALVSGVARGLLTSFLIIGLPYLYAGCVYYGHTSYHDYTHWLFLYSEDLPEYWTPLGPKMIVSDAIGFARTFYSTFFLYSIAPLRELLERVFRDQWLGEEIFLVRNMNPAVGVLNLLSVAVSALTVIIFMVVNRSRAKVNRRRHKDLVVILGLYALTLSAFFTFWSSTNPEFWIPQNLIFWMTLVLLFFDDGIRSHRVVAAVVISSLLLVNFFGGIVYSKDKSNDMYYQRLHAILEQRDINPLVISLNSGVMKDYLVRYKVKRFFCIEEAHRKSYKDTADLKTAMDSLIAGNTNGAAYATSEIMNPEPGKYPQDLLVFLKGYWNQAYLRVEMRKAGADDAYYSVRYVGPTAEGKK